MGRALFRSSDKRISYRNCWPLHTNWWSRYCNKSPNTTICYTVYTTNEARKCTWNWQYMYKTDIHFAGRVFTDLFRDIWTNYVIPNEWNKGIIVKLPKKWNLQHCDNWRGITLLSVADQSHVHEHQRRPTNIDWWGGTWGGDWLYISGQQHQCWEQCTWGPTEGACSMAVPAMSTRPRTSVLRMTSTHPATRNANHR